MKNSLEVLIVDDTDGCRDLYALWLEAHDVRTAPNGSAALDMIDDGVDLLLVDWNMPGPSGLEVAAQVRRDGYDCHIIMVSSEVPDFALSDAPIDNYVRKPADRETLEQTVDQVVTTDAYQTALSEFFAVSATVGRVEAKAPHDQLESFEEYTKLREQAEQKRSQVNEILDKSTINWEAAFNSVFIAAQPEQPGATSPGTSLGQLQ